MKRWSGIVGGLVLMAVAFAAGNFIYRENVVGGRLNKVAVGLAEPCSRNTKVVAKRGGPVYQGPLYDTHIHAPLLLVPPKVFTSALPLAGEMAALGEDVSMDDIVCLLDREGSTGALVFFTVARFIESESIEAVRRVAKTYPDRIMPLVMGAPLPILSPGLGPSELESIFNADPGLLAGLGELTFYTDFFEGESPNDPKWMEMYEVVGKHGAIVMLHPALGQESELEEVFARNPGVTFILHSNEIEQALPGLLKKYPNVYYTLDTSDFTPLFEDEEVRNKEDFMALLEAHYDDFLASALRWQNVLEQYPDRFMWGTDRAKIWHFDPEVSAMLEQISREFIGRLDPAVQTRYAHTNAERLLAD